MTTRSDSNGRISAADRRAGGLAVFRVRPGDGKAEPPIVGFVGPARAIDDVFSGHLEWCLHAPSTVGQTPAGVSFALCRPDISPEHLVGQTPFVPWLRIAYGDLHDAAKETTDNAGAIDEPPRFAVDERPGE
jgi:hypothetical protein